ncbi:uncharacterized protein PV09_03032 [Verruconis gallopava]|uniref:DUF1330 domain-containing protein n=1 Tax=Verruconis gallopava TaxID=253628 RepID=A0A0D1XSX1_9PEZI|nr:uncharacterized protein PV09_03032 [Verruconis gallopava]KIW05826.1 hypothetical protein PV09_03032 [Verruconis gallopava]
MPACDVYLLSLKERSTIPLFISSLKHHGIVPIVQSRPLRWIILPSRISTVPLLAHNIHWNLFLVLPGNTEFSPLIEAHIAASWKVVAGVPSKLLQDFSEKNERLLNPDSVKPPDNTRRKIASSSQSLELSPELETWISDLPARVRTHPVSMFNLLAFNEGKKSDYLKYGKAFGESIGSRHGGNAKIVGNVIGGQGKGDGWDEIALAHYPSIEHFAAMLGSSDYQEVNHKYRLGALKDTCILCTMEINDNGDLAGGKKPNRL